MIVQYNLGNDPKITLVLHFYVFSHRKNTCPHPTMMATAAIDDPLPPFYIGANLEPTPKDDEASLSQAHCTVLMKNHLLTGMVLTMP